MYKLVIQDDEGKTTVVALIRDEITIGRKEGNTIRLTERNVSRRHARILRNDGTIQIEDLGSYNGVRVNGAKIAQRTALSVSDRAQIGDYLLELKADVKAEAAPPAEAPGKAAVDHALEHQLTTPMAVPPVPDAVPRAADDAPTIKAAAPVAGGKRARLVALSSNFAGQEWPLDGDEIVLGRTEDNDAVINHRSISRNHARLLRGADGKYTISDLQSANGVRINGEEHGKHELRRGDVIDLGHVRLRFVEPGEDFVFGRDAQVSDVPVASSSRPLVIGALAVLLVGGALAAYMVMSRGAEKTPAVAAGSGSGSGSGPVAMVTPDAARAVTKPDAAPPTGNAELVAKLTECRALIDREAWADLQACADDAAALDAGNAEAGALAEQARRELANSLRLGRITDAARAKNYEAVATEYGKVDLDSVYRERARAAHDKARDAYLAQQVASGKALARKGKCDELKRLAGQVGGPWPEVGTAVGAIECTAVTATPGDPPTGDNPPAACDFEALLKQAEASYNSGAMSPALKFAEQAIKCNGAPNKPRIIALLASCKMNNAAKANQYYKQVGANTPASLLAPCLELLKL